MKFIKNIVLILAGLVFIVSSTGVMVYQTHCCCAGGEQISVFKNPETCNHEKGEYFAHIYGMDGAESNDHSITPASSKESECGCDAPKVYFFKLNNQVVNLASGLWKIEVPVTLENYFTINNEIIFNKEEQLPACHYADPPPEIDSSLDLLIQIHQLKIPFRQA